MEHKLPIDILFKIIFELFLFARRFFPSVFSGKCLIVIFIIEFLVQFALNVISALPILSLLRGGYQNRYFSIVPEKHFVV